MSVYICYAREDHAVAERIAGHLESAGIQADFDWKQYSQGSGFRARVEKMMRKADFVIYVMTSSSSGSGYCLDELAYAAGLGKRLVAAIPAPLPPEFVAPAPGFAEALHLYDDPSIESSGFAAAMDRIADLVANSSADAARSAGNPGRGARFRPLLDRLQGLAARRSAVYRHVPPILTALLSAALLFHLVFQPPSLVLVLLLGLAIIAIAAWRFRQDVQKDKAPFGTVWARSRLAWASLALLIPVSVGYTLHRQSHDGPARTIARLDAPVSAVAAGVTDSGEARVAYATYDGKLYLANPDSPDTPAFIALTDGEARPATQLFWHGTALVIAVREGEVLRWNGEDEPVLIWTGDGIPLVAMDEGQRLLIVETRPLRRGDARYTALSRIWEQSAENRGLSFDVAMSLTGQLDNFTFAISVADPLIGVAEAVHMQRQPILPTAVAASGRGAEAMLMIGGAEGELIACSESFRPSTVAASPDAPYFGCQSKLESGSSSPVMSITLSGDRGLTRHRDGSAVDWTRIGTAWRRGALPLALLTLDEHSGGLSVGFSPDGSRIVTASVDNTARVWDAATGGSLATLVGHSDGVFSVAFSPDGTRIVTASEDATARVWDAATGRSLGTLVGSSSYVSSAAFSPDGTRIVTASGDATARVWDAATGGSLVTLAGRSEFVHSAGFSPDGTRIVTMFDDLTARVWDAATGGSLATLAGHADSIDSAAFSPDGTRIVTASEDNTARIWDAATGRSLATLAGHSDYVFSAAFSPDGKRIVTVSGDATARVWDAATGGSLATLAGHAENVSSAAFSPDGSRIVTASTDGTARVWDAATGGVLLTLEGQGEGVTSAAFSRDGTRIVTASNYGTVRVWDAAPGAQASMSAGIQPPSSVGRMRLPGSDIELAAFRDHAPEMARLPDGRVVAGGWDGRVMIIDPAAAGAAAQADPAAWIASLWAPVGDTARTMFANIPGLGSSNAWERLSSADRAIMLDRNPRAQTDVWFAVGSIIATPRQGFTEAVLEQDTATDDPAGAAVRRSRLDLDRAVAARDRLGSALEGLGLSGSVTPNESGDLTTTIGGANPTRWQVATAPQQPEQSNDPGPDPLPQDTYSPRQQGAATPQRPAQSNDSASATRPQSASSSLQQTSAPAAPPPIPTRERFLGSSDIRSLFAAEAEAFCSGSYTPAQIQTDPVVATTCVVRRLRAAGEYAYVELDYIARPAQAARGFGVSAAMRGQWALGAGAGGARLDAMRAAAPIPAGQGVTVALIDTGIAGNHPSVAGAAWLAPGYDMVSDPLMGNDGDGRDSDPADAGDRCDTANAREIDSMHGTRMAGLVAAAGVQGLKIVPVRALGRCGGKLSDINDAIRWAAGITPARDAMGAETWNANPADIINLSFEFPVACPASLQAAINDAAAVGAMIVAAAGNGGRDASVWSPGGCNNVVSVGAADARGAPAAYSNFGAGIDLYAPGGDVSRDDDGDRVKDGVVSWGEGGARCVDAVTGEPRSACRHVMGAGTSNAAALTSAALAILKTQNAAATRSELVAQLTASTRESCVAHPNPRYRAACAGPTGGPVRLLGSETQREAAGRNATSEAEPAPATSVPENSAAFVRAMAFVERWEGGRVDSPGDPGGRSAMGVTQAQWDAYRGGQGLPPQDVFEITGEDAQLYYRTSYWPTAQPFVSEKVQIFMFDSSVSMGPRIAVRMLQQVIGSTDDGVLGPATIAAANQVSESDLLEGLFAERWSRYQQIAQLDPSQRAFLSGWSSRMRDLASEIGAPWPPPATPAQPQ